MEGVIDRIEGKIAIIELKGSFMMELPKKFLPKGAVEGDVLKFTIEIDKEAKKKRISKISELQKKLLKRK